MLRIEDRLDRCTGIDELMGCEGYAARQYFKGLGYLIEPEFAFERRTRRPPEDEFNALLSFGYAILYDEIHAKIEKRGLNAYIGILHQDREKHAALASDLMEEWRAVTVDAVAMSLINGHELHKEHFYKSEEGAGILLTKEGKKIFISKIEKKLKTKIKYLNYVDYAVTFRNALDLQISQLLKSMEMRDANVYQPVRIR